MRADKVRERDSGELENQLRESQDQLFRLRFQFGMGQMDGLNKYRELRRDRARMLGVLRERELDPAKAAEAEKSAAANTKKRGKKGK
jgi:large subunit ribosomal protein L29